MNTIMQIGGAEYSVVRELRGKGLSAVLLLNNRGKLRILLLERTSDRAWQLFTLGRVRKVRSGRGWADTKRGIVLE